MVEKKGAVGHRSKPYAAAETRPGADLICIDNCAEPGNMYRQLRKVFLGFLHGSLP
jgi:hypothetical protein